MVKYLGYTFKNYQELKEWNTQGAINRYKALCKLFSNATDAEYSMTLAAKMCDEALILHDTHGLTWKEIEAIEESTY